MDFPSAIVCFGLMCEHVAGRRVEEGDAGNGKNVARRRDFG